MDLNKVTVVSGGATHVTNPKTPQRTLCGRICYFTCDHGTETYCRRCQIKLSKISTQQP